MGNFPVKEIQAEWLVELIRDTYPPTPLYYEELINCEFNYNGTVQLIPNYLYKWDKKTVPPVADGVKWRAFTENYTSDLLLGTHCSDPDGWEFGDFKYFMILE